MHILLMLLLLMSDAAPQPQPARASIDAKIRGTAQPLVVELLLRDDAGEWKEVARKVLPANARNVRFDQLEAGAYQLRLRGKNATEVLATQILVGDGDERRKTITVTPFELTGRVTYGGADFRGEGLLVLRHREFHWRGGIPLAHDGSFRVPLWQRGSYTYSVRGGTLTTAHSDQLRIADGSPVRLDIPDGRITGIVVDAKSGAPVSGATVGLQSTTGETEHNVQTTTDGEGRFVLTAVKNGRQTVRIVSLGHIEPDPITFDLGGAERLRELDVRLDPGRRIPRLVIDERHDPAAGATVFAVSNARLRSRALTDEDGRADIAVPAGEPVTLFVIPRKGEGTFGVQRVAKEHDGGRLRIYLPRATSSLFIRARTTAGDPMGPFSLLMRFNGELVPAALADELRTTLGLQLGTGASSEALLQNIPSGSYEFWPYRTDEEAEAIVQSASVFAAPIAVNVRSGENAIAVKFARR